MARVVVDSNVLIAARLSGDSNHDRGAAIAQGIDEGELPAAYVPSPVVEEVVNYLQARSSPDVATETLDALIESSGFEVVHLPKSDFDAGRSLFRQYESLSLTDALTVAAMQRWNLEFCYTFDDGFDSVADITRPTTAHDPFEQ